MTDIDGIKSSIKSWMQQSIAINRMLKEGFMKIATTIPDGNYCLKEECDKHPWGNHINFSGHGNQHIDSVTVRRDIDELLIYVNSEKSGASQSVFDFCIEDKYAIYERFNSKFKNFHSKQR